MRKDNTTGLLVGVAAGLLWGLAFLLPELLHDWTPATLTAGRYLFYGVLSGVLFWVGGVAIRRLTRKYWRRALLYAITGNIGYYLLVVIGVHAAGAPITTMVIGCIPIAVALLGNWVDHSYPWRRLVLPIVLVGVGLVVVNGFELMSGTGTDTSVGSKILGILAAFVTLLMWATYGVSNARFLSANRDVPSAQWSTVVGTATGVITVVVLPFAWLAGLLGPVSGAAAPSLLGLAIGSVVLGMAVSWGGTWLWNVASARLPTGLAGMLVVVETVSGVTYVYIARGQWPPAVQLAGFAVIIAGVLLAVRRQRVEEPAAPVVPEDTIDVANEGVSTGRRPGRQA